MFYPQKTKTPSIKRLVEKIILIIRDSDFILVIKLAKTEGVYIILDSMKNPIADEMKENINYLKTTLICPKRKAPQPNNLWNYVAVAPKIPQKYCNIRTYNKIAGKFAIS